MEGPSEGAWDGRYVKAGGRNYYQTPMSQIKNQSLLSRLSPHQPPRPALSHPAASMLRRYLIHAFFNPGAFLLMFDVYV